MTEKQKEKLKEKTKNGKEKILGQFRLRLSNLESLFQLHTSSSAIVTFYHKRKLTTGKQNTVEELEGGGSVQYSPRVYTGPLFKRQKGDGVRDEARTRLFDCSDAWVAISAFSAPTSPEGHGRGDEVGRALKETKGGRLQTGEWDHERKKYTAFLQILYTKRHSRMNCYI